MTEDDFPEKKKAHQKRRAGGKADKKKGKTPHEQELTAKQKNPKAFAIQNVTKAERRVRRKEDITEKRKHQPTVDRTPLEPPPIVVAIVGPPKVGKSTLLHCLVKNFTRQTLTNIQGPVTVISGKKRRLTLIECNNDINSMLDIAKIADLVLLLVDASFGFEMEIFEFLNICQVHGFPRIMGVLTHLDTFKNNKALQRTKKNLKHRFWTEVYQGAKLFYLSGVIHGEYQKTEVHNLGRFISVMKFRPLVWRSTHPYVLADRLEDVTDPEALRLNRKCDRTVCLYGFLRGTNMKRDSAVHVAGVGDFRLADMTFLPDPCPLPEVLKKRSLVEKEKTIYAPMSGVGGVVYDKDAVYIDLGGSHSHQKQPRMDEQEDEEEEREGTDVIMQNIINTEATLNQKLDKSQLKLFSSSAAISSEDHLAGRTSIAVAGRRKVKFSDDKDDVVEDSDEFDDEDDEASDDDEDEVDDDDDDDDNDESDEEEDDSSSDENKEQSPAKARKRRIEEHSEKEAKKLKVSNAEAKRPSQTEGAIVKKPRVAKLRSEMSLKELNKDILREMGDSGDDEEEEEDDHNDEFPHLDHAQAPDQTILRQSQTKTAKVEKSSGKFHHRLATSKDMDNHSKVAEALAKISSSPKKEDNSLKISKKDESSDEESDSGEEQESDENEEVEEEMEVEEKQAECEEEEEEVVSLRWKADLAAKARDAFYARQSSTANLRKLVYGQQQDERAGGDDEDDEEEVGGLFRVVRDKESARTEQHQQADGADCSLLRVSDLHDWSLEDICLRIKDCFVTGKWAVGEDAAELLKLDDEDEEEVYGDFEDLETGEKSSGKENETIGEHEEEEEEEAPRIVDYGGDAAREKEKRKARMERKLKLKRQFDSEYDEDGDGKASFFEDLKKEVEEQANLNRSEWDGMEDSQRVLYEGFRPGMYVRMEIKGVPCELIEHHSPASPLVLGALLKGEDQIGYVQARLKKHRWHPRILKNRDPLILSLGWRRFQTLPIYSICDHNMRHRMLKYTPEHLHCDAHFWGPLTPQGTGLLAVQKLAERQEGFRLVATGVVLEMDKSTQIVKKLKLTGEPYKIFKKTAFIKGMFNSSLEVAKFESAQIRTVSGVRGILKKALSEPEGAFRATFEDKILLSDIVFIKTWFSVEVPKFYAPVTNLLLPLEQRTSWQGMRTVAEIKREKNIKNEANPDHLYLEVKREPKVFQPLQIPKALQAELPYSLKPKVAGKSADISGERVAVVLNQKEQKVANAFKMLRELYGDKKLREEQEKKKRVATFLKKKQGEEERKLKRQKEARKQISRMMSKNKAKEERMRNRKGQK